MNQRISLATRVLPFQNINAGNKSKNQLLLYIFEVFLQYSAYRECTLFQIFKNILCAYNKETLKTLTEKTYLANFASVVKILLSFNKREINHLINKQKQRQ